MISYLLRSLPLDSIYSNITNDSSALTLQLNNNESLTLPFTLADIYDSIYESPGILIPYGDIVEVTYGVESGYTFSLQKREQKLYLLITNTFPFVLSTQQSANSIANLIEFFLYEEISDSGVTAKSKVYEIDIYTDNLDEISNISKKTEHVPANGKDVVIVDYKFNKDSEGLNTSLESKYISRKSDGELLFKDSPDVIYKNIKDYEIPDNTDIELVPQDKIQLLIEADLSFHTTLSGGYITATFPHLGHTSDSEYYILTTANVLKKLTTGSIDLNEGVIRLIINDSSVAKIYGLYNTKKLTYDVKGIYSNSTTPYGFINNSLSATKNKTEYTELTYSSYLVKISNPALLITKGNISLDGIPYSDLSCITVDPGQYIVSKGTGNLSITTEDISYLNYQVYKDLIAAYNEESYASRLPLSSNVVNTLYGNIGIELYYIHDNTIFSKEIIYFKQ